MVNIISLFNNPLTKQEKIINKAILSRDEKTLTHFIKNKAFVRRKYNLEPTSVLHALYHSIGNTLEKRLNSNHQIYDDWELFRNIVKNVPKESLNILDNRQHNILFSCVNLNDIDSLKLFIEKGLNISQQDKLKQTILFLITNSKFFVPENMLDVLLINNINLDVQDYHGNTALFYAIWNRKYKISETLIKCGCNLKLKNNYGNKALDYILKAEIDKLPTYLKAVYEGEQMNDKIYLNIKRNKLNKNKMF